MFCGLQIDCHEDDLSTVALADDSSQILYSAGDDGLIKVCLEMPGLLTVSFN